MTARRNCGRRRPLESRPGGGPDSRVCVIYHLPARKPRRHAAPSRMPPAQWPYPTLSDAVPHRPGAKLGL